MQSLKTIEQLALKSTDITAITPKVNAKFVEEAARPHLYGRQLLRLNTQLERTQGTSVHLPLRGTASAYRINELTEPTHGENPSHGRSPNGAPTTHRGGSTQPTVKSKPNDGSNRKNPPTRSDSAKKPAPKPHIPRKKRLSYATVHSRRTLILSQPHPPGTGCSDGPPGIPGSPGGRVTPPPSAPDPASIQRPSLGRSLPGLTRFTRLQHTTPPYEDAGATADPTGQGIHGARRV
jgi:hypothetical protein